MSIYHSDPTCQVDIAKESVRDSGATASPRSKIRVSHGRVRPDHIGREREDVFARADGAPKTASGAGPRRCLILPLFERDKRGDL